VTAVAAATGGETRWVRAPGPCRPSKLRLEVDALRLPGDIRSGFRPRHIEQPAARHWAPAASKTRSRPSASAWAWTCIEPGTTSIVTPAATLRPASTDAAARRSSMRPLVHEPTKTVSALEEHWNGNTLVVQAGARPIHGARVHGQRLRRPAWFLRLRSVGVAGRGNEHRRAGHQFAEDDVWSSHNIGNAAVSTTPAAVIHSLFSSRLRADSGDIAHSIDLRSPAADGQISV
jgi:hypothetical protein